MKRLLFAIAIILTLGLQAVGQTRVRHTIVVNKWDNTLKYYQTGEPVRQFRVATGLYKCTPEGQFRIIQKSVISQHGRGQFGTRWLGLNTLGKRGWYRIGIHGTNEPKTIGKYASKACVRMLNSEINWLYERVPYGTTVRIVHVPTKPRLSLTSFLNALVPQRTVSAALGKGGAFQPSQSHLRKLSSPLERSEERYSQADFSGTLWWFREAS